ncbi:MAG TPA: site-2 protease family protein [Phycisphaerales bacterium]|nr:site-2 protease family protein [Phycisphaerales bacterium]HRQ75468.1 site-2 protease family protein [Phycisphaerales bacterium]
MSWHDRDYAQDDNPMRRLGRPGGDWQGLRPTFDNPFSWSVSMGRIAGIDVRIHIIFLIFIVIALLRSFTSLPHQATAVPVGFGIMAITMISLFVIVLLHEFGHCFACRWSGGEASEILMWPLGGLAFTRPEPSWQAHMITVLGGPLVNVLIAIVTVPLLWVLTGTFFGVALPHPIELFQGLYDPAVSSSWVMTTLYLFNTMNLLLLVFNLLLPIFPFDGGRVVQAALWPRFGYVRSMRFAVRTGYIGAILLAIYGAVFGNLWILAIAAFGLGTCWITSRQITFAEETAGGGEDYAASLALGSEPVDSDRPTRAERLEEKRLQRERDEAQEIDRILGKIAASGMDSLSRREKHLLERFTEKRRQGR